MTDPAISLDAYKELTISQIKEQREERLNYEVRAEYPSGSGNWFACAVASQNNWGNLAVLDARGLVSYPFSVTTWDEHSIYQITDSNDLTAIIGTVSAAVISERGYAQTFITAVNAATTQVEVDTAAAPYLSL